jgi:hypothetical protein
VGRRAVHPQTRYAAVRGPAAAAREEGAGEKERRRCVSAEELLARVWDEAADPFTNAVKITVSRLRAKLGEPPLIETVAKAGYRI